jgi:uncharacterized protein
MAPLNLSGLGHAGGNLVSVAFGVGFGFLLERAGFGNARKLASQFYLDDHTVLKVMFTAIVVAMVLIYWTSGLGWLDFEQVWVNPTYLWSGIIGGILLGVGFIIGGYCPGTSIVASATLKIDGMVFFLGCLLGIFAFGATVPWYEAFWEQAGFMGRYTIPEWLGLSYGTVVLLVVLMALGMFAGAEWLEAWFRKSSHAAGPGPRVWRLELSGAAALLLLGAGLALYARVVPDPARPRLLKQAEQEIASRERHIEPAELLSLMRNNQTVLSMLDVRDESDYNLFHLVDAHLVSPAQLKGAWPRSLPADAIKVVMSNGEAQANEAAKDLMARGLRNVYILAGGINHWLETFGPGTAPRVETSNSEALCYAFPSALGAHYAASSPDRWTVPEPPFTPKVKLERKVVKVKGGCGG